MSKKTKPDAETAPNSNGKKTKPDAETAPLAGPPELSLEEQLAEVQAEIKKIGDPSDKRMKLGRDRAAMFKEHQETRKALDKAMTELEQKILDAQTAEGPEQDRLVALRNQAADLTRQIAERDDSDRTREKMARDRAADEERAKKVAENAAIR